MGLAPVTQDLQDYEFFFATKNMSGEYLVS